MAAAIIGLVDLQDGQGGPGDIDLGTFGRVEGRQTGYEQPNRPNPDMSQPELIF
ncbi:hypothetical protein FKW77_007005 [Venturia effusa]|uniref:Uncharacterized protein n=1 Tax=Venturia effusa TaxID=50376 RepID=A0A517LKH1_9PEZI|nr:hypothetical protein FKW77_007005 [Venturia effusa]